jgi:hypothetical protein
VSREVDLAWAAGVFEGEGTWCVTKGRSAQAVVAMRDRDVVERLAEIINFGSVREIKRAERNPKHSDIYAWGVYNGPQVRALIAMFMPYLGERRKVKALEILEATEGAGSQGRSHYAVLEASGVSWN